MVSVVFDNLAAGLSPADIVRSHPSLQPDDVAAAIACAAELARERVVATPLGAAACSSSSMRTSLQIWVTCSAPAVTTPTLFSMSLCGELPTRPSRLTKQCS